MKKLLFLPLLWMVLFISCNKEDSDQPNELEIEGYIIKDAEGIDKRSISILKSTYDLQTFIIAIKNKDQIWAGVYDTATKAEIHTWTGNNPSNDKLEEIYLSQGVSTDIGYALNIDIYSDIHTHSGYGILLLDKKNSKIINYDFSTTSQRIISFSDKILINYFDYDSGGFPDRSVLISSAGEFIADSPSILGTSETLLLTGFTHDDRLVCWMYNMDYNLLNEWISSEKTERNIKLHIGYGEYIDYHIGIFYQTNILKTEWGYVIQPGYLYSHEAQYNLVYMDVLFLNEGEIFRNQLDKDVSFQDWYDGSILAREKNNIRNYHIYSPEGKIIRQGTDFPYFYLYEYLLYSISHESFIAYGGNRNLTVTRYDLNPETHSAWHISLKEVPDDTKSTWNIVKRTDKIFTYRIDLLYYDGTKEELNFTIDIHTGEITYL